MWPRRASQRTLADSDTAFIGDHHDVADVQIAPNDTPGLLIRAQSDMEPSTDRQLLLHDLDLMARQVNQLLHLAEASETQNYVFEFVDVVAVAEDVVD